MRPRICPDRLRRHLPLLVLLLLAFGTGLAAAQPAAISAEAGLIPLLSRVLSRDPAVRMQQSALGVADERLRQQKSRFFPELTIDASGGQARATDFGRSFDRNTDRAQASLGLNLFNSGRDRAEFEAAKLEQEAARAELQRAQDEVAERVANAYLELLRQQELLPRADERLAQARRINERIELQRGAGKVSDADALEAQGVVTDAELEQDQVRSSLDAARRQLERLTAEPAALPLPDWPLALQQPVAGDAAEQQPAQLDVAQRRAEAAQARVLPRWSLLAPRIDLRYDQQLRNRTTPPLTEQIERGWTVAARWVYQIGGEGHARVRESELRAEVAQADFERQRQALESERGGLPSRIASAERTLPRLERRLKQFETLLPAALAQYDAGRRSLTELGQMFETRFGLERRLAEQRFQLRAARLRWLMLSGGLMPALGLR